MLTPQQRTKIKDRAGLLSNQGLEDMASEFALYGHSAASKYVLELKAQRAIAQRASATPLEVAGEHRAQKPAHHRHDRQEIAPLTASHAVYAVKFAGVAGAVGGIGYGLCVLVIDFVIPALIVAAPYIAGLAVAAIAAFTVISSIWGEKKTARQPSGNTYIINVYQGDRVDVNQYPQ